MVQNKNLAYDFSRQLEKERVYEKKPEFKVIKSKKIKASVKPKSKVSLIFTTISIFAMLIVLSYRYNLISEKNLELQRKDQELNKVSSIFATTEIAIKQGSNLKYIENYAKQQLGMQKPEKIQIVYINADYKSEVINTQNKNIFQKMITKIKDIIK